MRSFLFEKYRPSDPSKRIKELANDNKPDRKVEETIRRSREEVAVGTTRNLAFLSEMD